ncbi:hypothetical protein JXA32_02085 [Candidatus Sumerlaeota bacterium]|nr:hypothetical protein [Candidatus Sumerlaeota bacterium]
MRYISSLLAVIFIFSSAYLAAAQETKGLNSRVQLSVSAAEESREIISGFFTEKLNGIQDVELVNRDPSWKIDVVVMDLLAQDGTKNGVVVSVVILRQFDTKTITAVSPPSQKKYMEILTNNLYRFEEHWVRTGTPDDLKNLCDAIIADFDAEHLDRQRKLHQKLHGKPGKTQ